MKNKRFIPLIFGLLLLAAFALMAACPQLFTNYGQKEMFLPWMKPDAEHILGTNALGYDIFTELVHGARQTLFIGVVSSVLTMLLGTFIGVAAAGKGILAPVFNGLINVFVLLPKLITLIVLASFVGSSQRNLILLISAFSWVGIARNVRAKVIHINGQTFIENCVIQGFKRPHVVLHHVIPNLYDVLLSRFLLGVNSCIMMESTLSFLGFGDLYYPTWGTMINFAYQRGAFIRQASWKQVMEMIENDQVETLVVKDLSRLGREYLQVGYYTEIYFPQKGVRFIAVNDGVDSLVASSTDFNPIRNWANELHAKDTSKKVRAIKRMQAERGERYGGKAPYGYKKRAADSKEIIPDGKRGHTGQPGVWIFRV